MADNFSKSYDGPRRGDQTVAIFPPTVGLSNRQGVLPATMGSGGGQQIRFPVMAGAGGQQQIRHPVMAGAGGQQQICHPVMAGAGGQQQSFHPVMAGAGGQQILPGAFQVSDLRTLLFSYLRRLLNKSQNMCFTTVNTLI